MPPKAPGFCLDRLFIRAVAWKVGAPENAVYVAYTLGQNGHGRTVVAPLSARPLPGAPVSCPLRWEEVTARLDPTRFTLKTVPTRFEKRGDPLAPVLTQSIDMATAVARVEEKLGARGSQ
jgi:bifunctional non-homologous end joining protein LigD